MRNEPRLTRTVEVFYSYSHEEEDERLKDGLLKQLAGVERQGVIASWHDRKITAGQEWAGRIDEHIDRADVILLLISPDFMASGYCTDIELKRAMERHEAGEARVIPVIMRPTLWKGAPFGRLQMLPTDARPVTLWPDRDEALLNVAEGILKAVEELAPRAAPPGSRRHPASNVPRPPAVGFIARRDEQGRDIIERLGQELAPDRNQLVALWGPGGSGKTTLAAEFVRAAAAAFKGRVAWVGALGRTEFGRATLLDEIATRLGRADLRKLAPEQKAAEVAALVSDDPTLVVLDNFETISEEGQARCLDFLAHEATCPALITTRSRVDRDDVYNVPLAAMTMEEARDFLGRLIDRTRKPSNFDRLERDDLIRRCEANPLILQWVVKQFDLAGRPQDVLDDLSQGEGDAAERVFTRSFNLPQLGDDGRDALLALSLFTPDASREALAEVSGFGDDPRRLDAGVEALSSLWLVEATEGNERLFLRGLTRELARSRLSRDERAWTFRSRYAVYFHRYARAHAKPEPADLDALEPERSNLLRAMEVGMEGRAYEGVVEIRAAIDNLIFLRGYWADALRSGEIAEAAARETTNESLVAYAIAFPAKVRLMLGQYEEAERIYRETLEISRRQNNGQHIAASLHQLGVIAQSQNDFEKAKQLYGEVLEIAGGRNDKAAISNAQHQLAMIALAQGDVDEARRLYLESLEIARELKDLHGVAISLHELGRLAQSEGDVEGARRLYNESLEVSKRVGDLNGIANLACNLGLLAEKEGDKVEAARLFREALSIYEKLGSPSADELRGVLARIESGPEGER